jgi:hypothetical protein
MLRGWHLARGESSCQGWHRGCEALRQLCKLLSDFELLRDGVRGGVSTEHVGRPASAKRCPPGCCRRRGSPWSLRRGRDQQSVLRQGRTAARGAGRWLRTAGEAFILRDAAGARTATLDRGCSRQPPAGANDRVHADLDEREIRLVQRVVAILDPICKQACVSDERLLARDRERVRRRELQT